MAGSLAVPVSDLDHVAGSLHAPVVVVEYGDFECPICQSSEPAVKHLREMHGAKLAFVFRHYPLEDAHPNALLAAEATEAAGAQGKFWEMHDALYENQEDLGQPLIESLVEQLQLDAGKFATDLETRAFQSRVKKDFMGGVRSGVNGTPGLFINGERFDQGWDEESLTRALLAAAKSG